MLPLLAVCALEVIRLWPGDAPGALGSADKDIPTLTVVQPTKPCGSAIVVCPGGGYGMLADHEGAGYAKFLNRLGVTAFVLTYRLGSSGYRYPVELQDGQRAIRLVRSRAKEWGIDARKIGIMGSSAGGHLASMTLTHFDKGDKSAKDPIDRMSCRPDFGILCYAVISMEEQTHAGSRAQLLGDNPSLALEDETSSQKQVTKQTPPCFIWHTADDEAVPVANSQMFADALKAKGVPYELHIYPHGHHGLGLGGPPESNDLLPWTKELVRWLKGNGWSREVDH